MMAWLPTVSKLKADRTSKADLLRTKYKLPHISRNRKVERQRFADVLNFRDAFQLYGVVKTSRTCTIERARDCQKGVNLIRVEIVQDFREKFRR